MYASWHGSRYLKSVLGIIVMTRRQFITWFIAIVNTGLRSQLVVSEIIVIAEPWVSESALWKLESVFATARGAT